MDGHTEQLITGYDVGVIRPQLVAEDFKRRGEGTSRGDLRKIRKGLRTFHTLETMAQNIYKFQMTRTRSDLNRQLTTAMCNEMTHLQDFQVKLYEYGFTPSRFRFAYWLAGFAFGVISRLRGRRAVLRTGIWVESKAVTHYAELLKEVPWDDETRRMIGKDAADEEGHITRWRSLLEGDSQPSARVS